MAAFGAAAGGEWFSGYLIENSLSIDNVFVWALILAYFEVPRQYQHRVLFWGMFGALVLRAVFIFAGVALIERFEWMLFMFGAFLLYTAGKLLFSDGDAVDPAQEPVPGRRARFVPTHRRARRAEAVLRVDGRRSATPLFAVLLLVEATDVLFAVDSVPAVLAVSKSSSSSSRRTRSRSWACDRCTSCSPTCTPGSATCSRDWPSSSPSSASR